MYKHKHWIFFTEYKKRKQCTITRKAIFIIYVNHVVESMQGDMKAAQVTTVSQG